VRLDERADQQTRQFVAEVHGHGLKTGVSFPLHAGAGEWGILSLNCGDEGMQLRAKCDSVLAVGKLFSAYVQESARRCLLKRETIHADCQLTRREKESLVWMIEGKTAWEISQILGVSERTIVYHLQNAMAKLNVTNRAQAAARIVPELMTDPELIFGQLSSDRVADALVEVTSLPSGTKTDGTTAVPTMAGARRSASATGC
jgi:DNA-binding CsgD family transcriptional regulator